MSDGRSSPFTSDQPATPLDQHWAKDALLALVERTVLEPLPGHFQPDTPISQVAFADLLSRALPAPSRPVFVQLPQRFRGAAVSGSQATDTISAPDKKLTRAGAIAALAQHLFLLQPLVPEPILTTYFEDGKQVRAQERGAIAAATLAGLVVNYPDVRRLQPQDALTWADAAALLCRALGIATVPAQYVPWYATLDSLSPHAAVPFWQLRGNAYLVQEIQARLQKVQLYPAQPPPDGRFSLNTQTALHEFCQVLQLPNAQNYTFNAALAQALQSVDPVEFSLRAARNRDRIFREYFQQEAGYNASHLAFLDRGIDGSPFETLVESYPNYLGQSAAKLAQAVQPHKSQAASETGPSPSQPWPKIARSANARLFAHQLTTPAAIATTKAPATPSPLAHRPRCLAPQPYPQRGTLPPFEKNGLPFLHPDIQQACLCLGQFVDNQLAVNWLGRNALLNGELWSATKIIPLLNLISQVHSRAIQADIDNQIIRTGGRSQGYSIHDMAVDMVNYQYDISSSNALAAMFKLFSTPQSLESWLKGITGNTQLAFRGNYGEGPFMGRPVLWDKQLKQVVLQAPGVRHSGPNSLSVYDLTRLITMLGWHPHLPATAQLPRAQWKSLESIVRAMGKDSARYIDVAIERLGLSSAIQAPVIVSKMGFGYSSQRRRTELVYSAFVQFVDARLQAVNVNGFAPVRSFGLTLLAAKRLGNGNREATLLDARMAAEVTEILRRIMLDEWE